MPSVQNGRGDGSAVASSVRVLGEKASEPDRGSLGTPHRSPGQIAPFGNLLATIEELGQLVPVSGDEIGDEADPEGS